MDCLLLLLLVKGGRHGWPFGYRSEGKRKMLSLGTSLDTSLAAFSRPAGALRCARIDLAFDSARSVVLGCWLMGIRTSLLTDLSGAGAAGAIGTGGLVIGYRGCRRNA